MATVIWHVTIRPFGQPGAAPVVLEAVSVTQAGKVTSLGFRVLK